MSQRKATLLVLDASSDALGPFLAGAAGVVESTEPGTLDWLAVDDGDNAYAVFDIFESQAAREAHFSGDVAAALTQRADEFLSPTREPGTLGRVEHFEVLSSVPARGEAPARLFTRIELRAAAGQADALAEFLTAGAAVVEETEPGTLRWFALRNEAHTDRFAIVDWFADASGRAAHFEGSVAAALKSQADALVEGGWSAVLDAVKHGEVLATVAR